MSSIGCLLQKVICRSPKGQRWLSSERWFGEVVTIAGRYSSSGKFVTTCDGYNNNIRHIEFFHDSGNKLYELLLKTNSVLKNNTHKRQSIAVAMTGTNIQLRKTRYDIFDGLKSCQHADRDTCKAKITDQLWIQNNVEVDGKSQFKCHVPKETLFSDRIIYNTLRENTLGLCRPRPTFQPRINQCRAFSTLSEISNLRAMPVASKILEQEGGCVVSRRSMAGHSKWQNIQHIKSAKDSKRANLFSRLAVRIKAAVREGGSDDPKFNNQLARVLNEAKANDMPNATIASAIKSAAGKDSGTLQIVEIKGPGPCLWLAEAMTDKMKRVKADLSGRLKKHGCSISDGNTVIGAFEKKGLVEVAANEDEEIDVDSYLEIAIETGAEEVEERLDELGAKILAFTCDPDDLHTVRKALEGRELPVKSGSIIYIPRAPAMLAESDVENLQVIVEKIEDHPEVVRVFDNIQVAES